MVVKEESKSQRQFTIFISESELASIRAALLQAKFCDSSDDRRLKLLSAIEALGELHT